MRSVTLALALMLGTPAFGQSATHDSKGPWRTVVTDHYRVHYPVVAEVWALEVAEQLDGIRDRVSEEVGFAPEHRVDIVVMDPFRDSNGFALPFLRRPRMGVFATPPGASSALGNYRTWAEDLVVHEDAHLVHLMRPTRGPFRGALQSLLGMGPVATNSPAWVVEGYATVVEGRLTSRGRPNSDFRATLLRSLAQEGQLPTYEGLNGSERWASEGFRYLVGSAYLEWLEAREHDGALRDLWARMTARKKRKFDASFEGVFGDDPKTLYGEFVAALTRDAMAIEGARAPQAGTRFADLAGSTGEPALSPDGKMLAVVVATDDGPRRLKVWSTEPNEEAADEWDEAVAELLEKDPDDVPADRPEVFAPEKLYMRMRNDRGVQAPRWTPDGAILFASWTPNRDGWARPDLYLWDPESGSERRVTRGANVIEADVHPDGARAFAVQTNWGVQQLVEVDLDSGDWTPLHEGATAVLDSPRVHPDGLSMVYLRNAGEGWQVVLRTLASGDERVVSTPHDAIASDPAWTADGTLIVSLARDGFIELAALDLDGGEPRRLTATRGGAFSPTAGAEEVFFLTMDAVGRDIHRIALPAAPSGTEATPDASVVEDESVTDNETELASKPEPEIEPEPAIEGVREDSAWLSREDFSGLGPLAVRPEPPAPIGTPETEEVTPRRYGIGRLELRPLAGTTVGPHHTGLQGMLHVGDVAGRLDVMALAGWRSERPGGADGFGLAAAYRGPARVRVHGYRVRESAHRANYSVARQGVELGIGHDWAWTGGAAGIEIGGLADVGFGESSGLRNFGYGTASIAHVQWAGTVALLAELEGDVQIGATDNASWSRTQAGGAAGVGGRGWSVAGRGVFGTVAGGTELDAYRLGGQRSTLMPEAMHIGHVLVPAFASGSAFGDSRSSISAELDIQGNVASWQRHRVGDAEVEIIALTSRLWLEPTPLVGIPGLDVEAGASCTIVGLDGRVDKPCTHLADYAGWASIVWRP